MLTGETARIVETEPNPDHRSAQERAAELCKTLTRQLEFARQETKNWQRAFVEITNERDELQKQFDQEELQCSRWREMATEAAKWYHGDEE
jgi:hypothetical protein